MLLKLLITSFNYSIDQDDYNLWAVRRFLNYIHIENKRASGINGSISVKMSSVIPWCPNGPEYPANYKNTRYFLVVLIRVGWSRDRGLNIELAYTQTARRDCGSGGDVDLLRNCCATDNNRPIRAKRRSIHPSSIRNGVRLNIFLTPGQRCQGKTWC